MILLIVVIGLACLGNSAALAQLTLRRAAERALATERVRVADLMNRLSAHSYESYAALQPEFQAAAAPEPPPHRLYDSTGLIEIDIPDGE